MNTVQQRIEKQIASSLEGGRITVFVSAAEISVLETSITHLIQPWLQDWFINTWYVMDKDHGKAWGICFSKKQIYPTNPYLGGEVISLELRNTGCGKNSYPEISKRILK